MNIFDIQMFSKSKQRLLLSLVITILLLCFVINKNLDSNDYKIFLTENSLNDNEKLFRLLDDTRYDAPITSKWNRDLAFAYRDMAGIGYVSKESANMQINEILKGKDKDERKIGFFFRKFLEIGDWEHVNTHTGEKDINYFSYSILRNKRIGKVIFTFSGTKGVKQLFTEYLNSGLETFYKYDEKQTEDSDINLTQDDILKNLQKLNENSSNPQEDIKKDKKKQAKFTIKNFKIMKYFNHVYKTVYEQLIVDVKRALSSEITQYVFVGHSLGGAIASIAAYDLVTEGLIPVTKGPVVSPVLITYGQPRTGNYVFANEVSKKIPIIFRHVNNFDIITSMPDCYKSGKYCANEYAKTKIDLEFSDYESIKIDENIYRTNSFPWHLNGLILNVDDDNSNECINNSEAEANDNLSLVLLDERNNEKNSCLVESKMRIAFHTVYYGYKISDMFKPEIFKYHLTEISCSLEDLFDFDLKLPFFTSIQSLSDYLLRKAPIPIEAEEPIDENFAFLEEDKKEEIKTIEKKMLFSNTQGICYYLLKMFRFFGKYQ